MSALALIHGCQAKAEVIKASVTQARLRDGIFFHEPSMVRTDNTPRVEPLKPGASLNRSDGGIDSMTRMLF
jgi:hypothetical protein